MTVDDELVIKLVIPLKKEKPVATIVMFRPKTGKFPVPSYVDQDSKQMTPQHLLAFDGEGYYACMTMERFM